MVSEGGEIGSAVGGKTEGQPYHTHALPKKDKLKLAYSEVVYGCNYDPKLGFIWAFEMAGSDRHVLHVRRPFAYTNEMAYISPGWGGLWFSLLFQARNYEYAIGRTLYAARTGHVTNE